MIGRPRARSRLVVQPFVLKCPECGAPSEWGARSCEYCKVTLTWSAQHPLTEVDDEVGQPIIASSLEMPAIGVGPVVVVAGGEAVCSVRPQAPFQPRALYIPSTIASAFEVTDIRVGHISQFLAPGGITGTAFSHGEGMQFQWDPCPVGCDIVICVRNLHVEPYIFSAVIRGVRIDSHTSNPIHCTCGASPGPAFVPNPHLAWRHKSFCPHSRSSTHGR